MLLTMLKIWILVCISWVAFCSDIALANYFCSQSLTEKDLLTTRLPLTERHHLRLMTFNLYNFTYTQNPKDRSRAVQIGHIILASQPDVILLQEVLRENEFNQFNSEILSNAYEPFFISGIDNSSHHLAFLVRRSLKADIRILSHITLSWKSPNNSHETPIFIRDFPMLHLSTPNKMVSLFIGNHHGVSSKDYRTTKDTETLRAKQVEAISKIAHALGEIYRHPSPNVIIGGDFNFSFYNNPNVRELNTGLKDAFGLGGQPLSFKQRTTYVRFDDFGPHEEVIDGFFVSPNTKVIRIKVNRFSHINPRSGQEIIYPIPQTLEERQRQLSDHFPVIMDINIKSSDSKKPLDKSSMRRNPTISSNP